MRLRPFPALLLVALVAVACSPTASGPSGPAGPDQVTPDDAMKAAGARASAAAFVRAYASDTGAEPTTLAGLVDGDRLERWVHWLRIQDREFPGTISGVVEDDRIGPATPFEVASVPGSDALLREVDVRASITFSFQPDSGETVTLSRSLDGPMRLLFDERTGMWSVLDFTRDGIPLSQTFEIVGPKGATSSGRGVDVAVDAFVSVPYWQFFLQVSSAGAATLASKDAVLLNADGARAAVAREVTSSLRSLASGRDVEGIVTFPAQTSADGLTMRLTFRRPGGVTRLEIPLQDLIHPIAMVSGSPSPSP
jgi:hypothetical protein